MSYSNGTFYYMFKNLPSRKKVGNSDDHFPLNKVVEVPSDLEVHLLGDLRDEVQVNDALVLGLVQSVVGTVGGEVRCGGFVESLVQILFLNPSLAKTKD